ncbi:uncharacterized protein BJ171DRAFT_632240 [Polychytrium aggregatum]|uniref:uncharacterized protein n=1 Tax=Polychytrium aggregatum TaxID=110093 RepID=UPI0022FEA36C|nr:uncharacterized protein BJ171DRAFT_632240 [Polychytrium aggregatum]KAI9199300.1 hypothetical protein BJ171DRAFT_632240 [Polychytrium aggregatum]
MKFLEILLLLILIMKLLQQPCVIETIHVIEASLSSAMPIGTLAGSVRYHATDSNNLEATTSGKACQLRSDIGVTSTQSRPCQIAAHLRKELEAQEDQTPYITTESTRILQMAMYLSNGIQPPTTQTIAHGASVAYVAESNLTLKVIEALAIIFQLMFIMVISLLAIAYCTGYMDLFSIVSCCSDDIQATADTTEQNNAQSCNCFDGPDSSLESHSDQSDSASTLDAELESKPEVTKKSKNEDSMEQGSEHSQPPSPEPMCDAAQYDNDTQSREPAPEQLAGGSVNSPSVDANPTWSFEATTSEVLRQYDILIEKANESVDYEEIARLCGLASMLMVMYTAVVTDPIRLSLGHYNHAMSYYLSDSYFEALFYVTKALSILENAGLLPQTYEQSLNEDSRISSYYMLLLKGQVLVEINKSSEAAEYVKIIEGIYLDNIHSNHFLSLKADALTRIDQYEQALEALKDMEGTYEGTLQIYFELKASCAIGLGPRFLGMAVEALANLANLAPDRFGHIFNDYNQRLQTINWAMDMLQLSEESVFGQDSSLALKAVTKAYRVMSLKYHPDKHPEDQETYTVKFQHLQNAYQHMEATINEQDKINMELAARPKW